MVVHRVSHVSVIGMTLQDWFCTKRLRVLTRFRRDFALSRIRDTFDVQPMLNRLVGGPTFGTVI